MDEREKVKDELQKMRDEEHSWRSIAHYWGIPNEWANLRRIYTGGNVGDDIIKRVALAMGFIKPRSPLDAYRPVIQPEALRTVATGNEIADLLEAMERMGVNMGYVMMLLKRADEQGSQFQLVEMVKTHEQLMREMEGI